MPETNPYLFPRCTTTNSHLRGSDVMRRFAAECGASKPHLLTSTRLRKHVATTAQVLGLKEHEMDMLANFLGHDIKIHTYFYRMPLDVLQIARVSKVFLAAERGHSSRHAGKGLREINTEDTEEVELEDDDDIDEDVVADCSTSHMLPVHQGKRVQIVLPARRCQCTREGEYRLF